MKTNKIIFTIMFAFIFANTAIAGITDAIAIVVNNKPITLFEIDNTMMQNKSTKAIAAEKLINDILYKDELIKNNISTDIFEIESYIEKMAKRENAGIIEYKAMLKQKYPNYEQFLDQIKQQISHEKFVSKIARTNLKVATDEDLKIYYENNLGKFQVANSFEIIQYASKSKSDLQNLQASPLKQFESIEKTSYSLEQQNLNQQIKYLLNETNEGTFTPIFVANNSFVTIFVSKKNGVAQIEFEKVKDKIFEIVMSSREDAFLKEYFNKLRITAKIEIIR